MQLDTLTCPSCMVKIEKSLVKQAGVSDVRVLFNASKVKVTFDSGLVASTTLVGVVEKLGYPVISTKVSEV